MFFGITASILVGFTWLISGAILGRAPKDGIKVRALFLLTSSFGGLCSFVIGFCTTGFPPVSGYTAAAALILAVGGFINAFQLLFISKAMQYGPNGTVWSIAQAGVIIPFLAGVLIFATPASWIRWLGFFLVLTGVALTGVLKNKAGGDYKNIWKVFALLSFLMTGLLQTFMNIPSYYEEMKVLSSVWRNVFSAFGMALGVFLVPVITGHAREYFADVVSCVHKKKTWLYFSLMSPFTLIVTYLLLFPAMDSLQECGAGAIAYPLMVGAGLVGFELYSIAVLHEKRTFIQILMLLLCIIGIVCLSF